MSRRRPHIPGTSSKPLRVLFLLREIPDDSPEDLKNALAIRNACATEGVCPDCGACGEIQGPDDHGIFHAVFRHEDACGVLRDPEAA
jgi:hypothetical protein